MRPRSSFETEYRVLIEIAINPGSSLTTIARSLSEVAAQGTVYNTVANAEATGLVAKAGKSSTGGAAYKLTPAGIEAVRTWYADIAELRVRFEGAIGR